MSLLSQYLALKHRSFFKDINLHESAQELSKQIDHREVKGKEIYLYHSNPMKFAVAFLQLLDRGAAPVCLSSSKVRYDDSFSFFEGEWEGDRAKESFYSEASYSVLTSGTTGIPKRCHFLLKNAKGNALAHAKAFEINGDFEILQTLPVYHSYGIIAYILSPLVVGAAVNFCPGLVGLRPLAKNSSDKKIILHTSPAQARFIMADKFSDFGDLKKITIGGGALSWGELESLQNKLSGRDLYVSYGLTEAGPRVSTGKFTPKLAEELGLEANDYWIGSPISSVEIKITDGVGHLGVSSPYLKANLSPDELIENKWYPTRDHVKVVNENIIFLSRDNDLLKYGGVTIYPKDIEDQVRKWTEVNDALILKKIDRVYEDVPYLFIEGSISEEEAVLRLEKEVPQALFIKKVLVLEKFPRQSLDKVDRKKLQELIEG